MAYKEFKKIKLTARNLKILCKTKESTYFIFRNRKLISLLA